MSWFASPSAMTCATASVVIIGFTPEHVGRTDASQTKSPGRSQHSPVGETTDARRSTPMRHVPIWCADLSVDYR